VASVTTNTALFLLFGAGGGVGLWMLLDGVVRRYRTPWSRRPHRRRGPQRLRAATAAGTGVLAGVVTGWVVAAVLTAVAVWFLPRLLARDRDHVRRVARIEAIATWAEMMRDTLAAAAGLEQAVLASAAVAPDSIRAEVTAFASRVESGQRLAPSLRRLADDLDDPTADLVISSLVLASTQQARNVSDLLGSLAATARAQASMRLRVHAGRARSRTSVRVIVATTVCFAGGLVLLNRDYLSVYDSPGGQLVLLVIGALFAAGFAALARISAVDEPSRVLAPTADRIPSREKGMA
jgi:Flp pilus assembly protein TadB